MRFAADITAVLSRLMIGGIFLYSGALKAMAPAATRASFAKLGIAAVYPAYYVALGVEILVALALVIGWKTRWAGFVLAAWCLATAVLVHYHPGQRGETIQLLKNLCMAGGLVQIVLHGAGRLSVDRR